MIQLMLPWQQLKLRGVKKTFFLKNVFQFRLQKWNWRASLSNPNNYCYIFHPQTTDIKPFKVECIFDKNAQISTRRHHYL